MTNHHPFAYLEVPADCKVFENRFEQLPYALSLRPEGVCIEFGVYKGKTTRLIGDTIGEQTLWAFDSFTGLPKQWDFGARIHPKGHFNLQGKIPPLTKNTVPVVGQIERTLPKWIEQQKDLKVAFMHIDTDLYESAKFILAALKQYFVAGTVIVFDELADFQSPQVYTNWRQGEYKALSEEIASYKIVSRTKQNSVAIVL